MSKRNLDVDLDMCYICATFVHMIHKTKPTGVRFDIEKLEFIKKREKLETNQQVVDFLLNSYWWQWKVATPTAKECPPIEKFRNELAEQMIKNHSVPAPSALVVANKPYEARTKTVNEYALERRELPQDDEAGYFKWLDRLENDQNLTVKQKSLAKSL